MTPRRSVQLSWYVASIVQACCAAVNSCVARSPFGKRHTVSGPINGWAKSRSRSSGAQPRAVTTSTTWGGTASDDNRRGGDACRLAKEGAFARIGLDQFNPRHARYRQHQTGKTRAAAEVHEALRSPRDIREELRRIEEMAAPEVPERVGADQVDARGPADQQFAIGFEPRQCFT